MQERDNVKKYKPKFLYFFSFEKTVQDRQNKCQYIFLLITLHTFIKTTTDYNLTICVKKEQQQNSKPRL